MTEGTLEANLPTVWTDERKSEMGRVREEKRREEKRRRNWTTVSPARKAGGGDKQSQEGEDSMNDDE